MKIKIKEEDKPKFRSGLAVRAMMRKAGRMKDKRKKRKNRNSWRKEETNG